MKKLWQGFVPLLLVSICLLAPVKPATAVETSDVLKAGGAVLGLYGGYSIYRGKELKGALALGGGYYAYKQGRNLDRRNNYREQQEAERAYQDWSNSRHYSYSNNYSDNDYYQRDNGSRRQDDDRYDYRHQDSDNCTTCQETRRCEITTYCTNSCSIHGSFGGDRYSRCPYDHSVQRCGYDECGRIYRYSVQSSYTITRRITYRCLVHGYVSSPCRED